MSDSRDNPISKIDSLSEQLKKSILDYFKNPEKYIGFKEIRWTKKIKYLNFFEKYFNVKYVHLIRDMNDQIKSINRLNWNLPTGTKEHIVKTNKTINSFLITRKTSQYIVKNISFDENFKQEIYDFIIR